MKQQILFVMIVCVFLSQLVLADVDTQRWNRHKGYYSEVNIGTNLLFLGVVGSDFAPATSGGFAWNVAGGYSFTPNHAVEGGFMQNYAFYEITEGVDISTNINVFYLAWRGTIPIKDRFAFFGKVGGMIITHPSTDEWLGLPYTGIGLSYAVTESLDISVQYQGAVYLIAGAGELSIGATYHF